MAYGNWGAFVYKNGIRQKNREDATPYKEEQYESGYYQAFGRSEHGYDPHHAVLGSGPLRLCAYKNYPVLYINGKTEETVFFRVDQELGIDEWEFSESNGIAGTLEGYKFTATPGDNSVHLQLIEPDGTKWTAECGYGIGAGHEEE